MNLLTRTDGSILAQWWWSVDRWLLGALGVLIALGVLMTAMASPAVAERLDLGSLHFLKRHLVMLVPAVGGMLIVSMMSPRLIKRLSVPGLLITFVALCLLPLIGQEIKGATRWLHIAGFSIQPSEFAKPLFVVVCGWLFAESSLDPRFPGRATAIVLLVMMVGLLALQPDIGMSFVIMAVWFAQFFLAGMPLIWLAGAIGIGLLGLLAAYFTFTHVSSRIDRFFDPEASGGYQVQQAMQAFESGGWFGRGPGEGTVKSDIPDAHSDFIFAVAGEELGIALCLAIVAVFGFVALRALGRIERSRDPFVVIAGTGLVLQFALQALVNMASTLHLMPTKGMTLPFISYGGSSLMAIALGMGMLLALSRRGADSGQVSATGDWSMVQPYRDAVSRAQHGDDSAWGTS